MSSHLDEEEPMEIDNPEDEESVPDPTPAPQSQPPVESESDSNSKDGTPAETNGEKEKSVNHVAEVEEITLNDGDEDEGDGEEAEELQLQLNAPDFGDEEEHMFNNGENSVDNMDDPLFQKDTENAEPEAEEQAENSTGGNTTENGEGDNDKIISLVDDDDEVIAIDEAGEKNQAGAGSDKEVTEVPTENGDENSKASGDSLICRETVAENDKDDDVVLEESQPNIHIRMGGIFEEQEEDEYEDDEDNKLVDVQSMMQMSFREEDQSQSSAPGTPNSKSNDAEADEPPAEESTPTRRHLPRRAAAAAASKTIRILSNEERDVEETSHRRGRREYDKTFRVSDHIGSPEAKKTAHKCAVCKKMASCPIKIQQFGTDVHLCSNACFNTMRHPVGKGTKRRLACVKCGISNQAGNLNYYWETMNFCSDLCVGNYQVDVGGKCATCFKKVPWLSLGKYCVRFGSDIRQFCTAPCLESYKKNARVCFHCQLDIKRLGNVILANIPSKNTPKEFCSQDCVEMYVEVNLNQGIKSKSSQMITCVICSEYRACFREVVLPSSAGFKVCSQICWNKLSEAKRLTKPTKCEKCPKYLNLEDEFEPPAHYVATEEKMYCFCSATCKNVFVLNNRQILSCTSCKVKKYNYDLVQYFTNRNFVYAVCSLNCLPRGDDYIKKLKGTLLPPSTASELFARNGTAPPGTGENDNETFPVINSVTSLPPQPAAVVSSSTGEGGISGLIQSHLASLSGTIILSNTSTNTMSTQGFETCVTSSSTQEYQTSTDEDNWDGIVRESDIQCILDVLEECAPKEVKTKSTMAKPKQKVMETQTDESALADMERVPLKTLEKIRYMPLPIPYPVYIPTPMYINETPVPYPVAVPIPIPMPVPLIFNESGDLHTGSSPVALLNGPTNNSDSKENGNSSDSKVVDITEDGSDCEVMAIDDDDSNSSAVDKSKQTVDEAPAKPTSNVEETPIPTKKVTSLISSNSSEAASSPGGGRSKLSRVEYGLRAWKAHFGATSDPINFTAEELTSKLVDWVNKAAKPTGERYRAYLILYFCLGVQQHLRENQRLDSIFYDPIYHPFVEAFTNYAETDCAQGIITPIEDIHFWESKELGESSPGVLLFSLIYFIFKYFNLRTWEKHTALHFGQIRIVKKYESEVLVKFLSIADLPECSTLFAREQPDTPEKCPVRLLEQYISKCEQTDGPFYKAIDPNFHPAAVSSPAAWFSTEPLGQMEIYRMLTRAMMIKTDSDEQDGS